MDLGLVKDREVFLRAENWCKRCKEDRCRVIKKFEFKCFAFNYEVQKCNMNL